MLYSLFLFWDIITSCSFVKLNALVILKFTYRWVFVILNAELFQKIEQHKISFPYVYSLFHMNCSGHFKRDEFSSTVLLKIKQKIQVLRLAPPRNIKNEKDECMHFNFSVSLHFVSIGDSCFHCLDSSLHVLFIWVLSLVSYPYQQIYIVMLLWFCQHSVVVSNTLLTWKRENYPVQVH